MKTEIGTTVWPDRVAAMADVAGWVDFYNQVRLHSSIGYVPPSELRAAYQRRWGLAA